MATIARESRAIRGVRPMATGGLSGAASLRATKNWGICVRPTGTVPILVMATLASVSGSCFPRSTS